MKNYTFEITDTFPWVPCVNTRNTHDDVIKMETFSALHAIFARNSPVFG